MELLFNVRQQHLAGLFNVPPFWITLKLIVSIIRGVSTLTDRWTSSQVAIARSCMLDTIALNWSYWTGMQFLSCQVIFTHAINNNFQGSETNIVSWSFFPQPCRDTMPNKIHMSNEQLSTSFYRIFINDFHSFKAAMIPLLVLWHAVRHKRQVLCIVVNLYCCISLQFQAAPESLKLRLKWYTLQMVISVYSAALSFVSSHCYQHAVLSF